MLFNWCNLVYIDPFGCILLPKKHEYKMNHIIAIVFIYLFLQMCFVWIIYRLIKNPSVVDASWSIGLMTSGLIYLWSLPMTPRSAVISMLIIIWALRLAGYLWYTRIRQGHVDKRYTELSTNWKISQSLGFFLNFQLQGLLIFYHFIYILFDSHFKQRQSESN